MEGLACGEVAGSRRPSHAKRWTTPAAAARGPTAKETPRGEECPERAVALPPGDERLEASRRPLRCRRIMSGHLGGARRELREKEAGGALAPPARSHSERIRYSAPTPR